MRVLVLMAALLGVGCWVLGVGCWVLGVGCWVLGVGCWVLGEGSIPNTQYPIPNSRYRNSTRISAMLTRGLLSMKSMTLFSTWSAKLWSLLTQANATVDRRQMSR